MADTRAYVVKYLDYCRDQKCLDAKTLKAYRIDLSQFADSTSGMDVGDITSDVLESYITKLHGDFRPKTVKRKVASLKAFFHYLEYKDIISTNPFGRIRVKFRVPVTLPKTIPMHTVELFLKTIYGQVDGARTQFQKDNALRDAAMMELLFATGMRISELCGLSVDDMDMESGVVLIHGKGSKERLIQVGSNAVMDTLERYVSLYGERMAGAGRFFVNRYGEPMSDQSVRRMINHYAAMAGLSQHITPHMFRHTFATGLLDNGVDIRYIQAMLGHSSINTTQIYTHVATDKQRRILEAKHPRNNLNVR